jgi:periplasmic protein TonB
MMLAYAASRPNAVARQSSPNALLFIISAHVAVAAVVMSIKMDLPRRIYQTPIPIIDLPTPVDPDPVKQPPQTHHAPAPIPTPTPLPPLPIPRDPPIDEGPTDNGGGTMTGGDTFGTGAGPSLGDPINLPPVRHDPRLLTPPAELKPPYPASKVAAEEEATLNLRLTIDNRGRVIAVEPLGRADATFVAAARRHLLAHWRYAPATDDGRAVATTLIITLRFQLDG